MTAAQWIGLGAPFILTLATWGLWHIDPRLRTKGIWILAGWTCFVVALGESRLLTNFESMPPRFLVFALIMFSFSFYFAFCEVGRALARELPLYALVGFQAFRFIPEMMILEGVREGITPPQMSLEGYNYDIVTAALALPAALWIHLRPAHARVVGRVFNLIGLGLLMNVIVIAILSLPTPLRMFMNEPANTWVATFPYILLPGTQVVAALVGHMLVIQKLRRDW